MFWTIFIIFSTVFIFWKIICRYRFWLDRGVKQTNFGFICGDQWSILFQKHNLAEMLQSIYNMYPKTRYTGFHLWFQPILLIKDIQLVKEITAKHFNHFTNHQEFFPIDHPFLCQNLFFQKNDVWRQMRQNLTPVFTSSKMKSMFSMILQNADQLVQHLLKQPEMIIVRDVKDTYTRIGNDVIANVTFGTECDSLKNPANDFYVKSRAIMEEGFMRSMRFYAFMTFPKIFEMFNISPFSKNAIEFFFDLVKATIRNREETKIVRPDMINILLKARTKGLQEEQICANPGFATAEDSIIHQSTKNHMSKMTDQDIASQGFGFIFAGYESVGSAMTFMSYELASNPEIQQQLIEEIDETREACDGKISYEALAKMQYLDMVLNETLRKWPPAVIMSRICNKSFMIEAQNPGEVPLLIEPGTTLWLSTFIIHKDPVFFPDPDKFDPERFSEENKKNIVSGSFFPFGNGPRNCIGSRLAILEIKAVFFKILTHFEIVPVEKTKINMGLQKGELNMLPEGLKVWLGFKRRTNTN